jgi:two-component system chemotaxis family response regulator WspR
MNACRGGVLIVDDEVLIADYLEMLVEDEGLPVLGVTGRPVEALAIAARTPPSLALVDLNLVIPGDGLLLAAELQANFGTRIILLSGTAEPQVRDDAAEIHAAGYLHKPFMPEELARLLHEALAEAA